MKMHGYIQMKYKNNLALVSFKKRNKEEIPYLKQILYDTQGPDIESWFFMKIPR